MTHPDDIRTRLFEHAFGPVPNELFGTAHVPTNSWPGGGIVQIAGHRPDDGYFTMTIGLTNPGLLDNPLSNPAEIAPRPDTAGYGYELVVCTRDRTQWPIQLLTATTAHLFHRGHDFLTEIDRFGGSFIDERLVVVPGFARVPSGGTLPHGAFRYLVIIAISPAEHDALFARPMKHSLPDVLAARADEWIDAGFSLKRASEPAESPDDPH